MIKRREFLKRSAWGGWILMGGQAACGRPEPEAVPAPAGGESVPPFELEEMTAGQLREGMESGRFSAGSICRLYLERIERVDSRGPELRSVLEVNPEALAIAEGLDRERAQGKIRGPLHGIPVLLKDNIDTADRLTTTAGSLALEGSIAARDSFLAERLRQAGAVILGKTNLSEWANFRSSRSSSGWSGRGGQCRNPYALDRNPCGSSSGSGAAVSANLAALAVGTETDGSIVCPSNANGIVGLKPTLGLVSRAGIIPIAHSQDTAGPMTRTVAEAAALLSALAGPDPRDPATAAALQHAQADYTRFLDPQGLKGARIGVVRGLFGFHEKVDAVMEEALAEMGRRGAVLVDPVELPARSEYRETEMQVLLYEFKQDLNAYLAGLGAGARVRSLEELIRFNEENREREMPFFGQETLIRAQEEAPTEAEYRKALRNNHRLTRAEGIDKAMDAHRLDALAAPTGGPAWTIDLLNGDRGLGGSSSPAAVAGYPNITVPAGFIHGLPVGISFFGRAWSEPTLIRLAYAFEQATQVRRPPRFLAGIA